jgi:hypothetical protein
VHWPTAGAFFKERSNLAMSAQHAAVPAIMDGLRKRSLEHSVHGVKRQQAFGVARFRTVVPLLMNARAIAQKIAIGC